MKELARYNGKVTNLLAPPQPSPVVLTEVATGKSVETTALSETLVKEGLATGDEFEVVIQQSLDGSVGGILRRKGNEEGSSFDI
jgi:hypothetical protein